MKRKHFLLTALTGLVAAILPKRGESAPMPRVTEVREPLTAPVTVPETNPVVAAVPSDVNELPKLCIFDTPDGFTVVPKYRGASCDDPLAQFCTIGVKWRVGEVQYGAYFEAEDENMFFDAEVLLYAVRNDRSLGQRLTAGGCIDKLTDDVADRLRTEYRAIITEITTPKFFPRPERTAAGSLLSL